VLIHSENYQALRLIQPKYEGRIKCIYIDPPYNSPSTEILYKNNYKHSSWASLMEARLATSSTLLRSDGSLIVAIDENEHFALGQLLAERFPSHVHTTIAIQHNPRGIQGNNFSYSHDYAHFVVPPGSGRIHP